MMQTQQRVHCLLEYTLKTLDVVLSRHNATEKL